MIMSDYVNSLLSSAGIPLSVDVKGLSLKSSKNWKRAKQFIEGTSNLVIIGPEQYRYVIKVMRMKLMLQPEKVMTMVTFNNIYFMPFIELLHKYGDRDVVAISSMSNTTSEPRKRNVCSFIDWMCSEGKQVLLASSGVDEFRSSVEYAWDTVDSNFDVLHYKD